MKKVIILLFVFFILYYLYGTILFKTVPYINEIKSNENYEILKISDSIPILTKWETIVEGKFENYKYHSPICIRETLLKDDNNNIYFFSEERYGLNPIESIRYKISKSFIVNVDKNNQDISLNSLYYTTFPSKKIDLDWKNRNGLESLNKDSPKPTIIKQRKEFFLSFLLKDLSKIFCFSLRESDCPRPTRSAEYIIEIPLRNRKIRIKSQGTVKNSSLTLFYVNNMKKDNSVFILYNGKLYVIKYKS